MSTTVDLGFIKAIHSGPTAPINTQMLWYDTNVNFHKYYDTGGGSWIALAGGAASWSTVLGAGAETLGTNPIISPGDSIEWQQGGFSLSVEVPVLTGNHTVQWQDAGGVVAYLSDIASAGNLNSVLTAGNTSGGQDILMSNGDAIRAASGNAYLDLRDGGVNGQALLYGVARAKMFGPTLVEIESAALISMKTTSGPTNAINSVGAGFGTGSPSSILHVVVNDDAPSAGNASVFKVTEGANQLHIGVESGNPYIETFNSWLQLQQSPGKAVGIGTSQNDPQTGSSDILLAVGDWNDASSHAIAINSHFTNAAWYQTYSSNGTQKVLQIGHWLGNNVRVENHSVGDHIEFAASITTGPLLIARIRGDEPSFEMYQEWNLKPSRFGLPGPHPGGVLSDGSTAGQVWVALEYTTAGTFTGIAGYYQGRMLILWNRGGQPITLNHAAYFTAGDAQMMLPGNTNFVLNTHDTIMFHYEANIDNTGRGAWICVGFNN